jgi:glycosyltransferase involved in cell wall biosynthesis
VSQQIRVLHIITRLNVGGPAFELQALQQYFTSSVQSKIMSGVCESDEGDFLAINNIRGELYSIDSLRRSIHPLRDFKSFFAIRRALILKRPQIVHTHMSKAGFLGRLACISLRQRPYMVHTFHGHVLDGYFGKAGTKLVIAIERYLARYSAKLLTIGTKTQSDLVHNHIGTSHQMVIVPTGMLPRKGKSRREVRRELGITQDRFVIIFAGRLTGIKRIDRLVDVILLLADKENLTWLVAGGGEEAYLIEDLINRNCVDIRFLGWRNDLDDIFSACDLSILVSDSEGTPLSIVQAGFHGVPTLATCVGSVGDLIKDNLNGFLVDKSPREISERIVSLIEHRDILVKAGKYCQEYFNEQFTGRRSAEVHEGVYREIINGEQGDEPRAFQYNQE